MSLLYNEIEEVVDSSSRIDSAWKVLKSHTYKRLNFDGQFCIAQYNKKSKSNKTYVALREVFEDEYDYEYGYCSCSYYSRYKKPCRHMLAILLVFDETNVEDIVKPVSKKKEDNNKVEQFKTVVIDGDDNTVELPEITSNRPGYLPSIYKVRCAHVEEKREHHILSTPSSPGVDYIRCKKCNKILHRYKVPYTQFASFVDNTKKKQDNSNSVVVRITISAACLGIIIILAILLTIYPTSPAIIAPLVILIFIFLFLIGSFFI